MGRKKANLAMEEAEIKRIEELNRRRKKALDDQAEIIRQEKELEEARQETIDPPAGEVGRETEMISEQMATVLEDLKEDGNFWVFRIENGRSAQCGTWPVADWPARMEEIAHEAGGGTFKIQFKRTNGQFMGQTTRTFDPKFYGKKKTDDAGGSGVMNVLAEMQRQTAALMESSRRDTMDMMKTLLTVVGGNKGPNYQEIAALGQIFKGSGGSDPLALVDVLKTGIELGSRMAEGKEPSSGLDRLIETIGAPAAALMSRMAAPVPARPAPAPAVPVSAPKPIAEPAPAPLPAPETNPVKANPFYQAYVPKILAAAKAGENPKEWAEYIADMIPALYHPQLLALMEKPELVEILGSYEPEARNYAPWIVKVRDEILALFPAAEGEERVETLKMNPEGKPAGELPAAVQQALEE